MKIAGRKNNGAWFRANKFIANLDADGANNLSGIIKLLPTLDAAFNIIGNIMATAGVVLPGAPANADAWAITLVQKGIPWQVWSGHLSFTVYDVVEGKRRGRGQSEFHYFAKDLRKAVTQFIFTYRAAKDLYNVGELHDLDGNPGGLPNADKNT